MSVVAKRSPISTTAEHLCNDAALLIISSLLLKSVFAPHYRPRPIKCIGHKSGHGLLQSYKVRDNVLLYCYAASYAVAHAAVTVGVRGPSVGRSVTIVSHAKTAELMEMPFGLWTRVVPRKHVIDGVHIGPTWRIRLRRRCSLLSNYFNQFFF